MARVCYGATISGTVNGAPRVTGAGPTDDPYAGASLTALSAAVTAADAAIAVVDADTAVLVADGATPTQAHVTTLNTDQALVDTAQAAVDTALTAVSAGGTFGDVVVSVNLAKVATRGKLKAALDAIYAQAQNSSLFSA